jgi:xanthine dehydrogenase small subunit
MKVLVNDTWVSPKTSGGRPALDFIRKEMGLKGTKEGCREGDCGACAVMVGEFMPPNSDGSAGRTNLAGRKAGETGAPDFPRQSRGPRYRAVPSCLLALGDLAGKHLITIEGLASVPGGLSPVMSAFLEENASQCGFCSPGFIISLSAWLAGSDRLDVGGALRAVDGNLCRCTGYGAIRRAAERLARDFADLPEVGMARLKALVERAVLPASVLDYADSAETRLEADGLAAAEGFAKEGFAGKGTILGGGTDFYVRNSDPEEGFHPLLLGGSRAFSEIGRADADGRHWLRLGAALRISDFFSSKAVRENIPGVEEFETQFASTLVRNLATLGGNIVNASPVADMSAMLLGLGAWVEIGTMPGRGRGTRRLSLDSFFIGYKQTALKPGEFIAAVLIPASSEGSEFAGSGAYDGEQGGESLSGRFEGGIGFGARGGRLFFSFEKAAKRDNLDIAAVNTAMSFRMDDAFARSVRISAGGVAEVPLLLGKAAAAMEGSRIKGAKAKDLAELCRRVKKLAEEESRPIDDVRGSATYRRSMVGRLVQAHFLRFFARDGIAEELDP